MVNNLNQAALISAQKLFALKDDPVIIILDATFTSRIKSNDNLVIPNGIFMDLQGKFKDQENPLPNTIPDSIHFEKEAQNLGINKDSIIVVYDQEGIYSSPRAWWLFKTMGHEKVYVLDGGLPEWVNQSFPTHNHYKKARVKGNFLATKKDWTLSSDFIKKNITKNKYLVVDARSNGRFIGKVEEPRKGLRGGHIPNSINLPYTELLSDGKYKPTKALHDIIEEICPTKKPLIFSCGSGVTACIVLLAASLICENPLYLFDGSWAEWALDNENPIEVGI